MNTKRLSDEEMLKLTGYALAKFAAIPECNASQCVWRSVSECEAELRQRVEEMPAVACEAAKDYAPPKFIPDNEPFGEIPIEDWEARALKAEERHDALFRQVNGDASLNPMDDQT